MTKEEYLRKCIAAYEQEPWISEVWEPYAKCDELERRKLQLLVNLITQFRPDSLGAFIAVFEKCSVGSQFNCADIEAGQDPNFLDKYLKNE